MEQELIDFVNNTDPLEKVTYEEENPMRKNIVGCMGDDPMSPYRIRTSKLVYKDIADIINNKPYSAVYPQTYTPIPKYFLDNGLTPYFSPMEGEDFAPGKLTIAGMIDLANTDQPFIIVRDQDFEEIYEITKTYLDQLLNLDLDRKYKAQEVRVRVFLNLLTAGLEKVYLRRNINDRGPNALVNILKKLVR